MNYNEDFVELDSTDPRNWPGQALDQMYADNNLPCNICIVGASCSRINWSMCDERINYYKNKLQSK